MLKSMRRNVQALKPILWIVIATFVISIFVIWGAGGNLGGGGGTNQLARIGDIRISGDDYVGALRRSIESMKQQFRELDANLIQQLNLPQQTLEQMIQEKLLLEMARDLGLRVSEREVRDEILTLPYFQKDGRFVGFEEYRRILEWSRMSLADFERDLRRGLLVRKVARLLTAGIAVSDEELWAEYVKTTESARLEYVYAETDKMEIPEKPDDEAVRARFEAGAKDYRIPEKRGGDYVFFKVEDLKASISIADDEIDAYYRQNESQFANPERIRVSRIYLPYAAEDKEKVLTEARALAARAAGEDFAELARARSKDDKAAAGGDWGFDEWRSLSPAETGAAAALEPGGVSEVVETETGAAILKVTEKEPRTIQPLAEVRDRIRTTIEDQKSRSLAAEKAAALEKRARKEKSLDVAAQMEGVMATPTGLLKSGEAIGDIDPSGAIASALFGLEGEKAVSAPVHTFAGTAVVQLRAIEPERDASLDEVRADVERDVLSGMKKTAAEAKVREIRAGLGEQWESRAKAAGLEYRTVEEHKREQYLSPFGENAEVDRLAFALPLKETSEPLDVGTGFAVLRVLGRTTADKAEFAKVEDEKRTELLETERNKLLQSFMARARAEKKIEINYQLYLDLNADVLARFGGESR